MSRVELDKSGKLFLTIKAYLKSVLLAVLIYKLLLNLEKKWLYDGVFKERWRIEIMHLFSIFASSVVRWSFTLPVK